MRSYARRPTTAMNSLTPFYELPNIDTRNLDQAFLDRNGQVQLHEAAYWHRFPIEHVQTWANRRARYGLPTKELIAFLKQVIGGRKAIEIGAGHGDLGRHLKIPMTDSYVQMLPEMQLLYRAQGQVPIEPPREVKRLEAMEAVLKYRPKVVVASWVTQLWQPGDTENVVGSFAYGADELKLLRYVETYVFIGNRNPHKDKRILKIPHKEYQFPWLVSRAYDPAQNLIWIWGPHDAGEYRGGLKP